MQRVATLQAADNASFIVRALPSNSVFTHTPRPQMQAAHAAGRCAPEEKSFSVRRKPRSGAPLCPTCDAALGAPLAIMGVRLRVRHQPAWCARGHMRSSGIA